MCWHCDLARRLEDKAGAADEAEADALRCLAMEQYERCDCP